ncbi:MAG: hypothetical protein JSU72_03245 [Deltaproteobacteria bacterium]|nr:MAG: hypothetical protein JSU72_03245 [Deltaproteobacteria bacterium]
MDKIESGLSGTVVMTVTEEWTARHVGSGRVEVYATPAMTALMGALITLS